MEANKCSIFVLPILGKHYMFYEKALDNVYLYEKDGLENVVCFVFNKSLTDSKAEELRNMSGYLSDKKGKFLYSIPDEYIEDIRLFKAGRYSLMSNDYKQRVLRCNIASTIKDITTSQLYGILYKTKGMREHWKKILGEELPQEAECWSIPNLQEEVLN